MVRATKYKRPNGYRYVRYFVGGRRSDEPTKTRSESAAECYRLRRKIGINAGIQPIRRAGVGELTSLYTESFTTGAAGIRVGGGSFAKDRSST